VIPDATRLLGERPALESASVGYEWVEAAKPGGSSLREIAEQVGISHTKGAFLLCVEYYFQQEPCSVGILYTLALAVEEPVSNLWKYMQQFG